MKLPALINLFTLLKNDNLCFAYTGSFSDLISTKIIDIARYNIDSKGKPAGLKNRVSFLMGECYQNIVRHGFNTSDIVNSDEKWSVFFLRIIGHDYFITSANRIINSDIPYLKSRLDRVNSMDTEELKELQKEVLSKGKLTKKGGAGLGIIMMSRKTGKDLNYQFEKLNEDTSLFYLHVHFKDNSNTEEKIVNQKVSLPEMTAMHSMLVKERTLIVHKGDFSEDILLPVLKMIESNLSKKFEYNFLSSRLYHVTVEVLQNISLHSHKVNGVSEGFFTLGITNDHYIISICNYIDKQKVVPFKNKLNSLKKLSKEELNKLYRQQLMLVLDKSDDTIGLGLIDIFRISTEIEFTFTDQGSVSLHSMVIKL